jgi:hypothetical protein
VQIKMFEQKRFAGRHLLTFESQKLNYFGKKLASRQGFQSGPVLGTSEITEPPKISGGQNHTYDWLVEYFS